MKDNPMKKKIGLIIILSIVILLIGSVGFYCYGMSPKDSDSSTTTFVLNPGTSKISAAEKLKEAGLIRSETALKIYLFFHSDLNLQAGTYELKSSMSPKEIMTKMAKGDIKNDTVSVTLIEGRRITEYVRVLASKLNFTEEEIWNKIQDREYLQKLIDKYWFLDESILNQELYYPLEGYLFPDTYVFYENSTIEEVLEKILNNTNNQLEAVKNRSTKLEYTTHQILAMASIIELEAVTESDRETVSQVIYKRLNNGMGLGMDVTTYYAVKKEMGAGLTLTDLKTISPYNTSEMNGSMAGKLPVGPICNPSKESILAVLNPTDTSYLYFYADIKTGKVYFSNTFEEHQKVIKEIG